MCARERGERGKSKMAEVGASVCVIIQLMNVKKYVMQYEREREECVDISAIGKDQ
jgi:hypothetical protein